MKKDIFGQLVQMDDRNYERVYVDAAKIKYKLYANLEQLLCDDQIAYEHKPGKPYASTVIQNRRMLEFFIRCGDELVVVKFINKKLKRNESKIPYCFKLFTKDGDGNEVLIPKDHYEVDLSYFQCFKYTFITGVKCHKVLVEDQLVWGKGEDDEYPVAMVLSKRKKVLLFFNEHFVIFSKFVYGYKPSESKSRKLTRKPK